MPEYVQKHRKPPLPAAQPPAQEEMMVTDVDRHVAADSDRLARSPHNVLKLQSTIGNQAVQRLIGDARQRIPADAVAPAAAIQRAPTDEASRSAVVLSIELDRKGKVEGTSRIAGHEGKVEVLSVSVNDKRESGRSGESVTFSKELDESSLAFMEAVRDGDTVKTAEFAFLRRGDSGSMETVRTIEFSDGMVAGYTNSGGGERSFDSIQLDFSKPEK